MTKRVRSASGWIRLDVLAWAKAEFQNTKRETMTRQCTYTKVLGIRLE